MACVGNVKAHDDFGQRRKSPNEPAAIAKLRELGVLSWKLDADSYENDPKLEAIRKARNYSYKARLPVRPLIRSMRTRYREHMASNGMQLHQ